MHPPNWICLSLSSGRLCIIESLLDDLVKYWNIEWQWRLSWCSICYMRININKCQYILHIIWSKQNYFHLWVIMIILQDYKRVENCIAKYVCVACLFFSKWAWFDLYLHTYIIGILSTTGVELGNRNANNVYVEIRRYRATY